jgi:hypothetical protein
VEHLLPLRVTLQCHQFVRGLKIRHFEPDTKASDSVSPHELSNPTARLQTHKDQPSLLVHESRAEITDHPDVDEVRASNINDDPPSVIERMQGWSIPEGTPEPAPSDSTSQASILPHTDLTGPELSDSDFSKARVLGADGVSSISPDDYVRSCVVRNKLLIIKVSPGSAKCPYCN